MATRQLTSRLLLLLALALIACTPQHADTKTLPIVMGGKTFNLELAVTNNQRFQGLSDRKQIAADGGMLFVFAEAEPRTFVMRKCYVPIDIIFLDPGQRIVAMHAMTVEPYNTPENKLKLYRSNWPAMYAIELAGGTLAKLKLKTGDKIPFVLGEDLKQQVQ
jgi:uncharacterized membrane protein (UPF0127 family)